MLNGSVADPGLFYYSDLIEQRTSHWIVAYELKFKSQNDVIQSTWLCATRAVKSRCAEFLGCLLRWEAPDLFGVLILVFSYDSNLVESSGIVGKNFPFDLRIEALHRFERT